MRRHVKRVDRDAMRRAIAILRQDPFWATHIEDKLKREGFEKAGHFASYSAQCDALHLKPWETPPCDTWGTVPDPSSWGSRPAEIELRDRLLAAGISVFEPDPVKALAEAERMRVA